MLLILQRMYILYAQILYRPEFFFRPYFKLQGTNENVSDTFKIDNFIYCKILSKFFVDVIFLHCCVGMWQVNFKTETCFSQSHTVFSGCFKYAAPFLSCYWTVWFGF